MKQLIFFILIITSLSLNAQGVKIQPKNCTTPTVDTDIKLLFSVVNDSIRIDSFDNKLGVIVGSPQFIDDAINKPQNVYKKCDGTDLLNGDKVYEVKDLSRQSGMGVTKLNGTDCLGNNDEYFDNGNVSYAAQYNVSGNVASGYLSRTLNGDHLTVSGIQSIAGSSAISTVSGNQSSIFNSVNCTNNGSNSSIENAYGSSLLGSATSRISGGFSNTINGGVGQITNSNNSSLNGTSTYATINSTTNSYMNDGYHSSIDNSQSCYILSGSPNSIISNSASSWINGINNGLFNTNLSFINGAAQSIIMGGNLNETYGSQSFSAGLGLVTNNHNYIALGRSNVAGLFGSSLVNSTIGSNNVLLVVGNGESKTDVSNALTIMSSGKTMVNATPTLPKTAAMVTPEVTAEFIGTDAIAIPAGTTAERPANPTNNATTKSYIRYNTTTGKFEGFDLNTSTWVNLN